MFNRKVSGSEDRSMDIPGGGGTGSASGIKGPLNAVSLTHLSANVPAIPASPTLGETPN